ncbi:hypothetical protein [Cellvibrio sp. PSBB006]|uniref:hypothetical protein n=1 Tax=Cellvibrio sp. PSBB006 TaxID=1987723 RepID=UPI000B3B240B|nr:hypothetical protein [Cellvibrio sp. PSBB006]ARU26173.1 hypothetical protein CBR65_01290 [Cellvibrio sp. PSBB006]
MKKNNRKKRVVYVIGAGFSAGLGFPTITNLLPKFLKKLDNSSLFHEIERIISFHHPKFNIKDKDTFPNVELLLSEMQANEQLFRASRITDGNFKADDLVNIRQEFLFELASWFHELQKKSLRNKPLWLEKFVDRIQQEQAQIISFNWDLVLDELLFGESHDRGNYGFGRRRDGVRLIKPHGSLNWYEGDTGRYIKKDKKYRLTGSKEKPFFAFMHYRGVFSTKRTYMPLIIPPVQIKQFRGALYRRLWQETVHIISEAHEINFLGYSLASADFHARFILRCGFHNQTEGIIKADGTREAPTGPAEVVVVDPSEASQKRIKDVIGNDCDYMWHKKTIEDWVLSKK